MGSYPVSHDLRDQQRRAPFGVTVASGPALTCLKGVGGISTRTRASRPDPLGYGAINTWCHHSGRHNKPMRRWNAFIRRSWRCQTQCDLRRASQWRSDKQPDIRVLRAHANGEKQIYIEGKCLSPISTARGKPSATRSAAQSAFFQTAPTIRTDVDSRYINYRRNGHRPVAILHEIFGGFGGDAETFFGECCSKLKSTHDPANGRNQLDGTQCASAGSPRHWGCYSEGHSCGST